MPPDTKPFRATERQKIIIISMAGKSQKTFYNDIFPVSTRRMFIMTRLGSASSANLYMQKRMLDFIISIMLQAKLSNEAAANCRVEQTEEGPMLNLMSISCTRSASSNAQAVEATCRDFWGRATVVRVFLHEGGI